MIPSQAFNSYSLLESHLSSVELLLHFSQQSVGHIRWDHFWVLRSVPLTCVSADAQAAGPGFLSPTDSFNEPTASSRGDRGSAHLPVTTKSGSQAPACPASPPAPPCGPAWRVGCEVHWTNKLFSV